jgi:hypothetical protein
MKIAIMQPYFFPYIGYFQLINAVDEFVIYDNIEFSKQGWINRNRILVNGKDSFVTLPLKSDSDYLDIRDRGLAENWPVERKQLLNRIREVYRKSPNFKEVYPVIEECLMIEEMNLFKFILNSLIMVKEYLEIETTFITSSEIPIDHSLKAERKVIALCQSRNATSYLNPIGGTQLYDKNTFKDSGLNLFFLKANDIIYKQFDNQFVPWLSIVDVLMFNSKEETRGLLELYALS